MAGSDPIDTRGHDQDAAVAQEPLLDTRADPASQTQPVFGTDELVLAQSAAEVQAQIDNVPGATESSS